VRRKKNHTKLISLGTHTASTLALKKIQQKKAANNVAEKCDRKKNRLWVCLKKSFLSFSSWQSHLHNIKK
jgi:hypothetical protein